MKDSAAIIQHLCIYLASPSSNGKITTLIHNTLTESYIILLLHSVVKKEACEIYRMGRKRVNHQKFFEVLLIPPHEKFVELSVENVGIMTTDICWAYNMTVMVLYARITNIESCYAKILIAFKQANISLPLSIVVYYDFLKTNLKVKWIIDSYHTILWNYPDFAKLNINEVINTKTALGVESCALSKIKMVFSYFQMAFVKKIRIYDN